MFNFFRKKRTDYPEYWTAYEQSFREKPKPEISDTRFVVLDTETTGFNYKSDRILSIGAVPVLHNTISIADVFEVYIQQDTFNPETVKIHGLLREDRRVEAISEEEAIRQFLAYTNNTVLVAHHANFDLTMINTALKRLGLPRLKNRVLDTSSLYTRSRITSNLIDYNKNYSLDELAETLNVARNDRHTATGDAYITALVFLKILSRLEKKGIYKTRELF
ncbi:3'-5' exonuclease [Sinomicrobium sp. M5D2P9]